MDMNDRRRRLQLAVDRLGSKVALGRRLGYQDGAFVGQMLRGDRPITEKTLDVLARLPELADLFRTTDAIRAQEPAAQYRAPATLVEALEVLGGHLTRVPPDMREAVATNLAGWARDGGRDHWRSVLQALLNSEPSKLRRTGT